MSRVDALARLGFGSDERESHAYRTALDLIRRAEETGATELKLKFPGREHLRVLPPELGRLTGLQFLNISGCYQLRDPGSVSTLTSLQWLIMLGCDQLRDLGPVSTLTSLQSLYVSGCYKLSDLGPVCPSGSATDR